MRRIGSNPVALWSAFVLAHLWLGLINLYGPGLPLGDVSIVYKFWSDQVYIADFWVGIHSAWVYPILAIFPMLAAGVFGAAFYASTWLSMIMFLDAIAFVVLIGYGRTSRHSAAAWWWIAFLILLGPIALGRIDSVTVPLAMIGALFIASRPLVATAILTVAAWVKVWPAAIVGAMIIAARDRWRVLTTALVLSLVIVGGALSFGSGSNVLSFITQQTSRGLQVESPVSTIWLWQAFGRVPGTIVYYDQQLLTWQVSGNGTGVASALMTPIMGLVIVAVVIVALLAMRRGAAANVLMAPLSLAFVASLIAFNKVGSPQFIAWFAVPIILGLTTTRPGHRWWFAVPAVLTAVTAALTQVIYPYLYGWLIGLFPLMLVTLSVRNILVFVLLGWAVYLVWDLGRDAENVEEPFGTVEEPASWPLVPER